ncbi:hypothetical protein KIPB_012790 [Kipferlia bialata]|uniref:Uncharacterized protein n=1 Tax=Kipferlia bialata TaxID=797122 RepID=A0A9K3D7M4_9EUKA|nr:hypothetical protein KIPB_012790 [Kipferlia bialata]|eukprot:g12790.t1
MCHRFSVTESVSAPVTYTCVPVPHMTCVSTVPTLLAASVLGVPTLTTPVACTTVHAPCAHSCAPLYHAPVSAYTLAPTLAPTLLLSLTMVGGARDTTLTET